MSREEYENYKKTIFGIKNGSDFEKAALEAFRVQYWNNEVYRKYCDLLGMTPENTDGIGNIPFLPIRLFKTAFVETAIDTGHNSETVFSSSATTGMVSSTHIVHDISLYEESFIRTFEHFYGDIRQYTILGLLPSYLEREGSSLVYMVDKLMKLSGSEDNGYYLYNYEELAGKLEMLRRSGKKTILFGVTFALVEMAESIGKINFKDLVIMETGGMKGRGREIRRDELHNMLERTFGASKIHSEYGMAELLSQAYSQGDGIFRTPSWMRILIRDLHDPFVYLEENGMAGGMNIIDLANINSCCFIETEDIGTVISHDENGSCIFSIDGRIKNSELRGCNMLL